MIFNVTFRTLLIGMKLCQRLVCTTQKWQNRISVALRISAKELLAYLQIFRLSNNFTSITSTSKSRQNVRKLIQSNKRVSFRSRILSKIASKCKILVKSLIFSALMIIAHSIYNLLKEHKIFKFILETNKANCENL